MYTRIFYIYFKRHKVGVEQCVTGGGMQSLITLYLINPFSFFDVLLTCRYAAPRLKRSILYRPIYVKIRAFRLAKIGG